MKTVKGDITKISQGVIVHGCNAKGKMGAGVALAIRNTFPDAYKVYMDAYYRGELFLGNISHTQVGKNLYVVNAVTQIHHSGNERHVNYGAIAECFSKVVKLTNELSQPDIDLPICFPMIGAGLAGGDWDVISEIIDFYVGNSGVLYVL